MSGPRPAPAFELATFDVDDVVVGDTMAWEDGKLLVDVRTLAAAAIDPPLADVRIDVVRPDESVRIANVLDAVLADVKADDPGRTFPGVLGELGIAGRRRTNRLGGVAVVPVCDWLSAGYTHADEFPDALIDMAGPGAGLTRWGRSIDVVVRCLPTAGAPLRDVDRAIRRASLRVARDLAAVTIGREPDTIETMERPRSDVDPTLPSIGVILQVASEGPLADTFLYGGPVGGIVPTVLDAAEILDGALTNGAYDWASVRNVTANYQDSSLLRSLLTGHGERVRFAGVILALGYLDTAFEKQRSAMLSARLAESLGADGVVCTTFSSGNSHTDTMLTVRACESLGIRTTAIVSETNGGLTDHVSEANCIVSVGNEDELVPPWDPDTIIGTDGPARAREPVPLWAYLGASVQTGDMSLMAVPA